MFKKDILLFDLEATGLDVTKHEIIQLAAILLDKKTLEEKQAFSTFIRPKKWAGRSRPAMAVNKISWAQVKDAPDLAQALTQFGQAFSLKDLTPAHYGGNIDVVFLTAAYRKAGKIYPFDYHTFDIWGLFYTYLALKQRLLNRQKFAGFGLEDIARHFKINVPGSRHEALTDCRVEAEVLRQVLKRLRA